MGDDEEGGGDGGGLGSFGMLGLCGICFAPFVLIGAAAMIFHGEKRAVCQGKAISQGKDKAVEVGCDSTSDGAGELVLFVCDLQKTGLQPTELTVDSTIFNVSFAGTCLQIESELNQCQETATKKKKDKPTTYSYRTSWVSSAGSTKTFRDTVKSQAACGPGIQQSVPWNEGVPKSGTQYATSVKAGAWTLEEGLEGIPCNTPVDDADLKDWPSGTSVGWSWKESQSQYWYKDISRAGSYKVSFKGNDWSNPRVTGLGKNSGGVIKQWTAKSDWLCSGHTLLDVRPGIKSLDVLFEELEAENNSLTWVLRVVGFLLFYLGFICCFGPCVFIAEMVDYIPCIGDCISDAMKCLIFAAACLPAASCCLFVTSVCWIAMRPMIGIPCLLFSLIFLGCFAGVGYYAKMQKAAEAEGGGDNPNKPMAQTMGSSA